MPIFNLRLTDAEMADLKARAAALKVPATEIVRRALFGAGSTKAAVKATPAPQQAKRPKVAPQHTNAIAAGSGPPQRGVRPTFRNEQGQDLFEPSIEAGAAAAVAVRASDPGRAAREAQERRDVILRRMARTGKG